jgi:EAL domain-containing protein (putative c-di-GMP-specific phosphodiesterase class I)
LECIRDDAGLKPAWLKLEITDTALLNNDHAALQALLRLRDMGSASIVRAIAQLGESLNLKVPAEGVETAEQLSFIRAHGCDYIQGFLTGRPVDTQQLDRLARHEILPS